MLSTLLRSCCSFPVRPSAPASIMASTVTSYLGNCTNSFAVAGVVAVSYLALKACFTILKAIRVYVLSKGGDVGAYLRSHGQWAVVTGATDGIGKAYCEQLASHKLNVVLISRTESKLKDVASEIESKYGVRTMIIPADFSNGMTIYDGIRQKLFGLDIGILVNNVGLSYEFPDMFLDVADREQVFMNLLNVNCTSATMMSSIVMPGMVERRKGLVINISSAAGTNPTPMLSVYSACKAYISYLSECLDYEYSSKGVRVQCVTPYFVCSNMTRIRRSSLFVPSATGFVKSALATLGTTWNTHGYWAHALMDCVARKIPFGLVRSMAFKGMKAASIKAKKKAAAKKAK